jgi:hypothetical protein
MPEEKNPQGQSSPQEQTQPLAQSVIFKRDDDFEALYANHVQVESSVWDLKTIFGILDQSVVPNQIVQHTSINLPWTQVKLLAYYIRVAIALHELENGKIVIPPSVLPPDPAKITAEPFASASPQIKEAASKIYGDFIANL